MNNYLFQSEKCKIEARQRLTFTVCSSRQKSRHLTWYFRAWSCLLWATTFPPRNWAKSCWRVETIPQKSFRNTATLWHNPTNRTQRHHCTQLCNTAMHFSWWSLLHSMTFSTVHLCISLYDAFLCISGAVLFYTLALTLLMNYWMHPCTFCTSDRFKEHLG